MPQRRLNKKVALIGSAVFAVVVLVSILVILTADRDPEKLLQDAQAALTTAHQATDERTKEQNYDRAERNFHRAYSRADTDELRQKVLFEMLDMYLETQEWPFILTCWDEIININPNNAQARYGRLRYFQIIGESGVSGVWQRVCEDASEFLKTTENTELLLEETAQWDVPGLERKETGRHYLGPYLYMLRGIGSLEMARQGAVTNKEEVLTQAVNDLEKAQQLDPNNIDTYWHLARAAVAKGEILASLGNFDERDEALKQAEEFLRHAVKISPSNPKAHINLLQLNLMLARNSDSEPRIKQLRSLETDYLTLANNFGTNAEVFSALSEFYLMYSKFSGPALCYGNLNNAIEAIEKARSLDGQNVIYAIIASDLYYRRFSSYQQESDIDKAIEIAKEALTLPEAQDISGPKHQTRIINRFQLYSFLANCYVEQILASGIQKSESQTKTLISNVEHAVHEIEQILGSNEEPLAIKWQGMLELARGNRKAAVQKLYSAYEQLKALKPSKPPWPRDMEFANLSYTLAKIFKDSSESGAIREFLISSLHSGISDIKPEAQLDYAEIALDFIPWTEVIQHINAYEQSNGPSPKSRGVLIKTYIRAMQFEDAEKELAKIQEQNAEKIKLQLELIQARIKQIQLAIAQKNKQESLIPQKTEPDEEETSYIQFEENQYATKELNDYIQQKAELALTLLAIEPNAVGKSLLISICRNYTAQGELNQVNDFINRYLEHFPDNTAALVYKRVLQEPSPRDVPLQKYKDIEEQVLLGLPDSGEKSLQLGIFYHRNNQFDKATKHLTDAVAKATSKDHAAEGPGVNRIKIAVDYIFNIALATNDWNLAERTVKTARDEDIDGCLGMVYESRLAAAKGDYKNALAKIDECLKQRPVFSLAYLLRSNINAALGNESASDKDIREAAYLNPLDGTIAKGAAIALYNRNQNLGDNVLPNQVTEVRKSMERAIALNLGDLELLSLYAEFIAPTEPLRAVAIRQDILDAQPGMENALLLGKLATEAALEQIASESKDALFDIAESAFEQARNMNHKDKRMLYYFAEYLRARGREDEAMKLLRESQDEQLLWDHYFQLGRYEDAMLILEKAYKNNSKDVRILKGLIQAAEKTADQESVKKYSEKLVHLEDTVDNNLAQIQAYLRTGLIKEAELKLQSIKEKYPNESRILLLQAWLLMKQGQLEKALKLTNQILQSDKDNAVAWRLRGEININLAQYDKAISDLRTSKLLSDDPIIRVSLARAYLNARRHKDAITELKNAIIGPTAPREARLLLEHIYILLDRNEALNRFYDDTLEKFPDNADWINRAAAFALKTGQYEKAEQLYSKACQVRRQIDPGQSPEELIEDLLYARAFDGYLKALLMGAGEPGSDKWNPDKINQVIEECKKHLNSSFAPIAYLRMAEANYNLGNKSITAEYCRIAIDKTGTNEALASEVLMRMFMMLGADEVTNYCVQRLETNPDSIAANFVMFNLVNIKGEYIKALDYINKCIDLTGPENPNRVNYITKKVDNLIRVYEQTSDNKYIKMAVSVYESLLSEMPKNINVLNNFAYLLADYNLRLPEALQYAKQALDAKPNDPGIMDTYAYVLYKNGKNTEASEFVDAALQQYSEQKINLIPPEVYEHKGMIKEQTGEKDEALAAYKMAIETGSDILSETDRRRINQAIERVSP